MNSWQVRKKKVCQVNFTVQLVSTAIRDNTTVVQVAIFGIHKFASILSMAIALKATSVSSRTVRKQIQQTNNLSWIQTLQTHKGKTEESIVIVAATASHHAGGDLREAATFRRIGGERLKKVRLFSQDEVRARYRERNPFLYITQLPRKMGRTRNALLLGAWKNVPGILLGYLTSYCSNDVHLTRTKHPLFPSLYFIKTRHLVNCRVGISELGAGVVHFCSATHST